MASSASNKITYLLATGAVNFSSNTFKIILMQPGFSFDKDSHHYYGNVSGSELASGNGYTTGGNTLTGVTVTEDDTYDWTKILWSNTSWVASGGNVTASGAIIINDSGASDPIVGYIDFVGDQTVLDGATFTIANPQVRVKNA